MHVFISWSGPRSRFAAEALQAWLRQVVQAAEPWISADIEKGTRWNPTIADRLEQSKVGIIVLTRDNLGSTWIHFEAGALSKTKDAYLCTLLLDIAPSDVGHPLGQFQHTIAEKSDLLQLTKTINGALGDSGSHRLKENVLEAVFETNWPRLEAALERARNLPTAEAGAESRSDRELLKEVLEILRTQERRTASALEHSRVSRSPTGSSAQDILNDALRELLQNSRETGRAPSAGVGPGEADRDDKQAPADT